MTEQDVFQQQFGALAVTTRAALVFRYREGLPLSHVAQLVDRPAGKLEQHLDRTVTRLLEAGALESAGSESTGSESAASESAGRESAEEVLRRRLEDLRGDPALSAFSLVCAVRAEQNRRGLLRGRVMGRFA